MIFSFAGYMWPCNLCSTLTLSHLYIKPILHTFGTCRICKLKVHTYSVELKLRRGKKDQFIFIGWWEICNSELIWDDSTSTPDSIAATIHRQHFLFTPKRKSSFSKEKNFTLPVCSQVNINISTTNDQKIFLVNILLTLHIGALGSWRVCNSQTAEHI
jgi:hypothetical protein